MIEALRLVRGLRWLVVLAASVMVSGCFFNVSQTPVLERETALGALPLQDGVYCFLDEDADAEDEIVPSEDDCGPWAFDASTRELVIEGDGDRMAFLATTLGRGIYLFQGRMEDDQAYTLVFAVLTEEGLAILPALETEDFDLTQAPMDRVMWDHGASLLSIEGGAPEDALAALTSAMGQTLDAALRDPEVSDDMIEGITYALRVGEAMSSTPIARWRLQPQVDALQRGVRSAMTLE